MNRNFSTSRLCSLVLDVWYSVTQENSWALVQPPGPLGSASNRSPQSSLGDLEDRKLGLAVDETNEDVCILKENSTRTTNLVPVVSNNDLTWEMARFLLNEERDRFFLWQTDFSNDELDQLIKAPTDSPLYVLGLAVVESLLRVGDALLRQTGKL